MGCTLEQVLRAALSTGCQATALGQAIIEVNRMVCPPICMLYDLVSQYQLAASLCSNHIVQRLSRKPVHGSWTGG